VLAEHRGDLSRVGRATVYRHWPRTGQLLAGAMATVPMPFFAAPTEPMREWLRAELTAIARQLELDDVRAVATTLVNTVPWGPQMAARRGAVAQVLADRLAAVLTTPQDQGHPALHIDSSDAAALLLGPLYCRSTIEQLRRGPSNTGRLPLATGAGRADDTGGGR